MVLLLLSCDINYSNEIAIEIFLYQYQFFKLTQEIFDDGSFIHTIWPNIFKSLYALLVQCKPFAAKPNTVLTLCKSTTCCQILKILRKYLVAVAGMMIVQESATFGSRATCGSLNPQLWLFLEVNKNLF